MTLDEVFLRDIRQHPEDDALRLVVADWLQDHDRPAWAAFIRLRHELAGVVDNAGRRADLVQRERLLLAEVAVSGPPLPEVLLQAPRIRPGPGSPPLHLINSIGMQLILIPAGRFLMGNAVPEEGRVAPPQSEDDDVSGVAIDHACPQHVVTLTRPFYLGVCAVTWAQYARVMTDDLDLEDESDDHPVHNLCWGEAADFCEALSGFPEERAAGRVYRLPTEAEWEYACRADTTTRYWCGDVLTRAQATFACEGPTPVGSFPPNSFGLFDMHGNVLECCDDTLGDYRAEAQVDPRGSAPTDLCVFRGGSFETVAADCASARRFADSGSHFNWDLGLRVALSVPAAGHRKGMQ